MKMSSIKCHRNFWGFLFNDFISCLKPVIQENLHQLIASYLHHALVHCLLFSFLFCFSEKNATYPAEARRRPWCSQGPVNGERCAVFQYYKYNYCTINQPNLTVKLWHKNVLVPLRGVSLTDWHEWCIFQSHEISTSWNAFLSICSLGWRLFISAVAEAAPWVDWVSCYKL